MIWLTGCKGMLGAEIALFLELHGLPYIGTDIEIDICGMEGLLSFVENQQQAVTWIINCAAYTAVDKAEDDQERCRLLNVSGAGNIAVVAKKIGARLVHISTDYVFNGHGTRPYTETDATDPIGVYGLSKRDGELAVLSNSPDSYIIRTAWLYGKHGSNFVRTMLKLMNERENVSVVNDQRGCPTWTYDLAEAIIALLGSADTPYGVPFGTYHFTNEGEITWFDFAGEIYRQGRDLGILTRDCRVTPCSSADFPARVRRPAYSVLDKSKIKTALGITIPAWDVSLQKYLASSRNY